MSWIAEYDTQGREFPTCVHVTKTTGTMTNGAAYVPIEDGRAVRAENAKLRELLGDALKTLFYKRLDGSVGCTENCTRWQFGKYCQMVDGCWLELEAAKLGIEVDV